MLRSGHGRKGVNHGHRRRGTGARAVLATGPGAVAAERTFGAGVLPGGGRQRAAFYWWRRKLERRDQPKQPAFLPVHVVAEEASEPATRGIEVVLANGRCLRVGPGFDPHTLVTLVDLLEAGGPSC